MSRREPAENVSEMGQARSHSVLVLVGGRLALKLRGRKRVASGTTLTRPCRCEGYGPQGEDVHAPQYLCPGLLGLAYSSGPIGCGGVHSPLLPIAQPHSAAEISRGPPQLARG